jgi:DMSO/TMAO reductase YedYZ heme-binding membrane subunit
MKDVRFTKFVVLVNGFVPLALLGWDFWRGTVGPNPKEYVLRTTGMLALVFLLLSLCVTPLRRLSGYNALSHFRRMLGLYAFFYGLVHLSFWFAVDRGLDFGAAWEDVQERSFILIGMVTLVMLIPLAATSTNAMIKRMGALKWKQLHRLAYVAAMGGVIHYCMVGKVLTRLPMGFIGALVVLLGYRVVMGVRDYVKRARLERSRGLEVVR